MCAEEGGRLTLELFNLNYIIYILGSQRPMLHQFTMEEPQCLYKHVHFQQIHTLKNKKVPTNMKHKNVFNITKTTRAETHISSKWL